MPSDLDVLVVDDRPESVRFLTEFLIQRCRRVDVSSSVREAMTAVSRRRSAGERYHLIFSDFVMPETDGLALLRDLRGRQDGVPFVFITGFRAFNPAFEPEAKRLGVMAILDKPIDLNLVEAVLAQVVAGLGKRQAEEPFFGTSRMYRRPAGASTAAPQATSDALEPRVAKPVSLPPPESYQTPRLPGGGLDPTPAAPPLPPSRSPPVTMAGYQRRPSGIIPMGTGTGSVRRLVGPVATPQPGTGTGPITRSLSNQPPTALTARVWRGVEGTASFQNPNSARGDQPKMVECAHCHKQFLVANKPVVFTTVCVHCGQLQQVDPG